MKNIDIIKYNTEHHYHLWNSFLETANNSTFLFHRDYMEYHKDRFEDFSLMIFQDKTLLALIPAHQKDQQLYSHWGLTFGGLIVKNMNIHFLEIMHSVSDWLKNKGFTHWHIKPILKIYSSENKDFDWLSAGFEIASTDENLAVDYSDYKIESKKMRYYRKNKILNYQIIEEQPDAFWNEILQPNLREKHNTQPVHSLCEISLLKKRFPKNIKQFSLYFEGKIQAGVTIYESKRVAKSQYCSISEEGKKIRALDSLFIYLIESYKDMGKKYFDIGTVMDDKFPNRINTGLKKQKIELGCKVDFLTKYTKKL